VREIWVVKSNVFLMTSNTSIGPRSLDEILWPELESTLIKYTSFYNDPGHERPQDPNVELERIRQAIIPATSQFLN
jgi:hypothetical protein